MVKVDFREGIYEVFKKVATPLNFFSAVILLLVILIVIIATNSKLPDNINTILIFIILGFILLIAIGVYILILCKPKHLTFDKEAYITIMREKLSDSELGDYHYFPGTTPTMIPKTFFKPNSSEQEDNKAEKEK